ncbi:MAG: tetratricopeptide repeat protein [Clostridiales bacterium]|nr:tetratricopeptide repeat protein [Clostridiales bacterium]
MLCNKISYVTKVIIKSSQVNNGDICNIKDIFNGLGISKTYEYDDIYGKQKYIVLYSSILDEIKGTINKFNNDEVDILCLINYFIKNNFSCYDIISTVKLFFCNWIDILMEISEICINNKLFDCKRILEFLTNNNINNSRLFMALSKYYSNNKEYYLARQYVEKLSNDSEEINNIKKEVNTIIKIIENIKKFLWRIEFDIDIDSSLASLFKLLDETDSYEQLLLDSIKKYSVDKIYVLNYIAIKLFEYGKYENVLPLLIYAHEIDNQDLDTVYNLAYILNQFGEKEVALSYLYKLNNKNEDIKTLIEEIRGNVYE